MTSVVMMSETTTDRRTTPCLIVNCRLVCLMESAMAVGCVCECDVYASEWSMPSPGPLSGHRGLTAFPRSGHPGLPMSVSPFPSPTPSVEIRPIPHRIIPSDSVHIHSHQMSTQVTESSLFGSVMAFFVPTWVFLGITL